MLYITLTFLIAVASHISDATPVPDPGGYHTHLKIHVPYEVKHMHHHHIEKIPVYKEIPVIKEVPVIKHYPVIKHVPVVKHVPVEVTKYVPLEKKVYVPVPIKEHHSFSEWH